MGCGYNYERQILIVQLLYCMLVANLKPLKWALRHFGSGTYLLNLPWLMVLVMAECEELHTEDVLRPPYVC